MRQPGAGLYGMRAGFYPQKLNDAPMLQGVTYVTDKPFLLCQSVTHGMPKGQTIKPTKENMNSNIFSIKDNLKHFGFHYVLWSEGLSIRTIYNLWVAYGMTRHESTKTI